LQFHRQSALSQRSLISCLLVRKLACSRSTIPTSTTWQSAKHPRRIESIASTAASRRSNGSSTGAWL
jgi:hypothetical protein